MNTNVSRNDFLFFQNEVFKDIKELEKKLNEKISTITSNIDSNKLSADNNYQKFTEKISQIIHMVETAEERLKIDEQLSSFKKKIDDILCMNKAKITSLEKEINKITFKYDKIFLDNLTVPGVIGTACPFQTLSAFIEYSNKKIKELLIEKSKQNTDMRTYKDKLEIIIASFNKQIKNIEAQYIDYCNGRLKDYDKICNDRTNLLEEKIQNMRVENGKYSFDLIQKTNELKIKWEKIQQIQDDIYTRFNEEIVKHVYTSNNLCKIFNSQRDEFKLLKSRFTELSEFIKDVRFRNNINNALNETEYEKKVKFRNMSKRINFNLKQKLDNNEKDNSLDNINKIDYIPTHNDNKFNQSFSNFENNTNNNKFREKNGIVINKPINLGKVSSTLKNYFNQNKEYKTPKYKNNKLFTKILDNKNIYNKQKENNKVNKNNNSYSRNKNTNLIKEKESADFSEVDSKHIKKPILKKGKPLQSAKNMLKKNKHLILSIKKEKSNKNNDNNEIKELNINPIVKNKSSKALPFIGLKTESVNSLPIIQNRNKFVNMKLNSILQKNIKRKSLFTENNSKNLKIELIDNNKENKKSGSSKNLKTFSPSELKSKEMPTFKVLNEFNSKIPSLSINQIETIINSIINVNNNKNQNQNKNDKNNRNNKNNINTLNTQSDENENNLNTITSNEKIKRKTIEFLNDDNDSLSQNKDNNDENDNKLITKNKFSFLTNANIKQQTDKTEFNKNEVNNINYYALNKKLNKTIKRMNEIYQELDIKINKLYKYFKKILGDLTGRMFYKDTNKQNLFNLNIAPKSIFTSSNFIIPIRGKDKKPILSNEIDKIIKDKKMHSPKNLKKIDSFKSIVDQIEPYLIKKFKL